MGKKQKHKKKKKETAENACRALSPNKCASSLLFLPIGAVVVIYVLSFLLYSCKSVLPFLSVFVLLLENVKEARFKVASIPHSYRVHILAFVVQESGERKEGRKACFCSLFRFLHSPPVIELTPFFLFFFYYVRSVSAPFRSTFLFAITLFLLLFSCKWMCCVSLVGFRDR